MVCEKWAYLDSKLQNLRTVLIKSICRWHNNSKIVFFGQSRKYNVLWENEKMLVTSIFAFSYNVLKMVLPQGHET